MRDLLTASSLNYSCWFGRSGSKGVYLSNEVAFINCDLTLPRNLAKFHTDTHLITLN